MIPSLIEIGQVVRTLPPADEPSDSFEWLLISFARRGRTVVFSSHRGHIQMNGKGRGKKL